MDVPPPTPEEIRAATEAKTPMEAAMNRIKYSSKEIRELYEKAEQFTKEQTANERELAVAWKAYEATKAPLAEGIARLKMPGALNPNNPPPPLEPEYIGLPPLDDPWWKTKRGIPPGYGGDAPAAPPRKLDPGETPPPAPANPYSRFENLADSSDDEGKPSRDTLEGPVHSELDLEQLRAYSAMSAADFDEAIARQDADIAEKKTRNDDRERAIAEANATLRAVETKTAELSAAMARDAPMEELAALHCELDELVIQTSKHLPKDLPPPPARGDLSDESGAEEEKDDPSPRSDE